MEINEAREHVAKLFPFEGYMDKAVDSYENIAKTVQKYLAKGARILDFGAGPCDKTAVVQTLGFRCTAFDDLSDDWHKLQGNRERILEFAAEIGIDYKLASDGYLPFESESFDMVMSHDVIEHLHDSPRDLLNDLVDLLKPEGYLFITVPNAVNIRKRIAVLRGKTNLPSFDTYYWYPGAWRGHVREYVKDDLTKLCEYIDLEILELRSCHHMLKVLSPGVRAIHVLLSSFFTGWRDSWLLVARKSRGWIPKKDISGTRYQAILSKVTPYTH